MRSLCRARCSSRFLSTVFTKVSLCTLDPLHTRASAPAAVSHQWLRASLGLRRFSVAISGGVVSHCTNPNPKVRKSGAAAKAVLASIVLEEDGPIRAARGEDSRDIRRANHPAKGPAPPESIIFSVPVGFMLQKLEQRKKKKKEGGDEQGGPPFSSARNGPWKRPPGMEGRAGVLFYLCAPCALLLVKPRRWR